LSQLLSEGTVASCSSYIKCPMCSLCAVTEVVLFSVVAFKTMTFHTVV